MLAAAVVSSCAFRRRLGFVWLCFASDCAGRPTAACGDGGGGGGGWEAFSMWWLIQWHRTRVGLTAR